MATASLRTALAAIALATVAACLQAPASEDAPKTKSGRSTKAEAAEHAAAGTPTFYQDVRPLVRGHCASCHKAGEIGGFSLLGYDDVKARASAIANAVHARSMPPFPPESNDCEPLDDPRIMTDEERQTIEDWVAAGAPEGDSSKPAPDLAIAAQVLDDPTDGWDTGFDYRPAPKKGEQDDYRCFVIDPQLAKKLAYHAVDVAASNRAIAHHASIYVAQDEASIAKARALDAADPGPGYSCFGDSLVDGAEEIGGWTPGQPPRPMPGGTGSYLYPGDVFILQMHYNIANADGPDRARIRMWRPTSPITEEPDGFDVGDYDFEIPPRAANVSKSVFVDVVKDKDDPEETETNAGFLREVGMHQHLLGTHARMELVRADGTTKCLLDIPKWQFGWQGSYTFKKPVKLSPKDRIKVTCTWDNPTDKTVRYGEASSDEMCEGWGLTTQHD